MQSQGTCGPTLSGPSTPLWGLGSPVFGGALRLRSVLMERRSVCGTAEPQGDGGGGRASPHLVSGAWKGALFMEPTPCCRPGLVSDLDLTPWGVLGSFHR